MPLTSAQICRVARQNAHCRGFEPQSGYFLNVVLQELCQNYDFDVAKKALNFTFSGAVAPINNLNAQLASGPFTLPADYLRSAEGDIYYYPIGLGQFPLPLIPIDISEFDGLVQQAGFQNFPVYFVTDMSRSPPLAYVWPPASGQFPCLVRYYAQQADILTPELDATVPWFPNQQYLIDALTFRLMQMTGDTAAHQWEATSRDGLRRYLEMKDDKGNRAQSVKLDRRRFGKQYSTLPRSKYFGGW